MATAFDISSRQTSPQFTGNLLNIILTRREEGATLVKMCVDLDGVTLCPDIELFYDPDGKITIKTRDIAKGLIRYQKPEELVEQLSFPQLVFVFTDENDNTVEITMELIEGELPLVSGAEYDWWVNNFLTWQPQIVTMPIWQPQWLTFAKVHDISPAAIRIKSQLYTAEGEVLTQDIDVIEEAALTRINVSFAELWRQVEDLGLTPIAYDIYGIGLETPEYPDAGGRPNCPYVQRYVLRPDHFLDRCFIYQNSLGGFDSVMATGISTYLPTGDPNTFISNGEEAELSGAYTSVWSQNTGYISDKRIARQWHEFLNSTNRYLYNAEYNRWQKIIVDEYEIKDKAATLASYTFKYRLARPEEGAYFTRVELPAHPRSTKYFD